MLGSGHCFVQSTKWDFKTSACRLHILELNCGINLLIWKLLIKIWSLLQRLDMKMKIHWSYINRLRILLFYLNSNSIACDCDNALKIKEKITFSMHRLIYRFFVLSIFFSTSSHPLLHVGWMNCVRNFAILSKSNEEVMLLHISLALKHKASYGMKHSFPSCSFEVDSYNLYGECNHMMKLQQ